MSNPEDCAFLAHAEREGWPVCSCAECTRALSSQALTPDRKVAGRIKGRPYCARCLARSRTGGR